MRIKLILLGKTKGFGQGYEKITKRLAPLRGCKFEFHKCRIVFQTLGGLLEICSAVNLIRVLKLVEVRISLEKNPFQTHFKTSAPARRTSKSGHPVN